MKNKSFILGAGLAILGLLLLIIPNQIFKLSIVILGVLSIVNGILILHTERVLLADVFFRRSTLIRGIASLFVGVLVICFPLKFGEAMWTIACYGLGIWLIVSTVLEIFGIVQLHRNDKEFKSYLMETIVSFIVAILLFVLGHNNGLAAILRVSGLIMILAGAMLAVIAWKEKPVYVEAEAVETVTEEDATETEPETTESKGEN